MKGVRAVGMDKKKAKEAWVEYRDALKSGRVKNFITDYYRLKRLYHILSTGKKIIDLRKCFMAAGWNDKNEPRLAICSLGFEKRVQAIISPTTSATSEITFVAQTKPINSWNPFNSWKRNARISLAMPPFKEPKPQARRELIAPIPIVPPRYLPPAKDLREYFILWEVPDWHALPKRDPLLLKRIGDFTFVVLAAWDMTPLEQAMLG